MRQEKDIKSLDQTKNENEIIGNSNEINVNNTKEEKTEEDISIRKIKINSEGNHQKILKNNNIGNINSTNSINKQKEIHKYVNQYNTNNIIQINNFKKIIINSEGNHQQILKEKREEKDKKEAENEKEKGAEKQNNELDIENIYEANERVIKSKDIILKNYEEIIQFNRKYIYRKNYHPDLTSPNGIFIEKENEKKKKDAEILKEMKSQNKKVSKEKANFIILNP